MTNPEHMGATVIHGHHDVFVHARKIIVSEKASDPLSLQIEAGPINATDPRDKTLGHTRHTQLMVGAKRNRLHVTVLWLSICTPFCFVEICTLP